MAVQCCVWHGMQTLSSNEFSSAYSDHEYLLSLPRFPLPRYSTYTIEWTGTSGSDRYELDLYYCGSYCQEVSFGVNWWSSAHFRAGCTIVLSRYEALEIFLAKRMVHVIGQCVCGDTRAQHAVRLIDSPGNAWCVPLDTQISLRTFLFACFSVSLIRALHLRNSSLMPHVRSQDDCGDWVTALCPYGEEGCADSAGDFDVEMPDPATGSSGSGYKIRVMDVQDESSVGCSDEFYLVAAEEAPMVADSNEAYLVVTSPMDGDMAIAGGVYTVEVGVIEEYGIVS